MRINQSNGLNILAGYNTFLSSHSGVTPIGVEVADFEDSLGLALLDALQNAIQASQRRVRALVLSNPQNPLGRCYSAEVLKRCIQFCQENDIHLISDEVFGLSTFRSTDLPDASEFTSVFSLDPEALNADPNRIHLIWSLSKDFAASGVRLVSH
jgi:aspartate/methionine/tyrosine aminotransferase